MNEHYTERLADSEPIRKIYADSVSNAAALLKLSANLRRERLVTPKRMAERREEFREEYAKLLGIDICKEVFGEGIPKAELSPVGEDELCTIERILFHLCDGQDIALFHAAALNQCERFFVHKHPPRGDGRAVGDRLFAHVHHLCPALVIEMRKIRHIDYPPIWFMFRPASLRCCAESAAWRAGLNRIACRKTASISVSSSPLIENSVLE